MVRRHQQYLLVNYDAENNERPSLGGEGAEAGSSALQHQRPERASSSSSSTSSSSRRALSFSTPRRNRSSDSAGALTVSTASLNDYYSSSDDEFDVEDFMATEATDDDDFDVEDVHVVDVDLAASSNNVSISNSNDALQVWGRTIQVEAPCALPAGYVFTVDVVNGQQLLVEVPDDVGVVVEGQVFEATIVHVVNEANNDVDYERMYNLDPATRTSQLKRQQQLQQQQQPRQAQQQPKSTSTPRPAKQQQEDRKKKTHRIPRGAWRNGLFHCLEHGLFHPVLCIAGWCCCSPWLLGQVLTRMKLDACGNASSAIVDKLHEQPTKSSSARCRPFSSNNNTAAAFYTMVLLLMLHIVLIEHILSMFLMYGLSDHYDVMQHPMWVWMLLSIRATCRCSFLVYIMVVTVKTRRYMRQKYQIPRSAYCRSHIRGRCGGSSGSCSCPCRRRRHVYGKQQQQTVTAASSDDHGVDNDDHGCAATCEDCCLATFCNCCTIMQMARHTADYTSSRATCCTANGLT
jgi:hypothetical protein